MARPSRVRAIAILGLLGSFAGLTTESTRYHVRNIPTSDGQLWQYESRDVRSRGTYSILIRIFIGKIDPRKVEKMESILKGNLQIYPSTLPKLQIYPSPYKFT
jgi:hypothetical protein